MMAFKMRITLNIDRKNLHEHNDKRAHALLLTPNEFRYLTLRFRQIIKGRCEYPVSFCRNNSLKNG